MRLSILLAILLPLGAACSEPEPEPEPARSERKVGVVTVDPALVSSGRIRLTSVERRAVAGVIMATGQIEAAPDGAAEVTTPVMARVREIRVRRGDAIAKGAVLAVLDASEITRIRADLARARARRTHAARVLAQEQKLARENATSERALSDARSALSMAEADERAASSLLRGFGAVGGGRLEIVAPIAGSVTRIDAVLGKPVDATSPLFRIVDTKRLLVRADVAETDADAVPDGARATLTIAGRPLSCPATVESHAPHVDPNTRTLPFRVRLGAKCGEFHEGAFVDVAIEKQAIPGSKKLVSVSRDAVVSIDDVPLVFVATPNPGEFSPRKVRVAEYAGPRVFIEEGVNDGERVVDQGALLLKGELVRSRME